MIASRSIETGDADVMIAGAESMTRSPWVLMKPDNPFPVGDNTAVSTALS
jgi:acetyl-CoA acetyltransferase